MNDIVIEPARQGMYPAIVHLGHFYLPLSDDDVVRLKAAIGSPQEFYRALLETAGVSSYMREQIARLWAKGDPAEQTRRLQQAVARLAVP